jgi:hypothetical protein
MQASASVVFRSRKAVRAGAKRLDWYIPDGANIGPAVEALAATDGARHFFNLRAGEVLPIPHVCRVVLRTMQGASERIVRRRGCRRSGGREPRSVSIARSQNPMQAVQLQLYSSTMIAER